MDGFKTVVIRTYTNPDLTKEELQKILDEIKPRLEDLLFVIFQWPITITETIVKADGAYAWPHYHLNLGSVPSVDEYFRKMLGFALAVIRHEHPELKMDEEFHIR